jgi:hypothetical protein
MDAEIIYGRARELAGVEPHELDSRRAARSVYPSVLDR